MHFFNVQLPPESLEQTTPIIPVVYRPSSSVARLPEIEIERSRWQYCAKQRRLREVQKSVRWWEGQENVSPKSAGFFFFVKYQFGTWFFFWGDVFISFVMTFESSNPISAGSMMSLTMCFDRVGGLTWPREPCESVDVLPPQWQVKIYQDPLLKTVIVINSPGGDCYWVEEHHKIVL